MYKWFHMTGLKKLTLNWEKISMLVEVSFLFAFTGLMSKGKETTVMG